MCGGGHWRHRTDQFFAQNTPPPHSPADILFIPLSPFLFTFLFSRQILTGSHSDPPPISDTHTHTTPSHTHTHTPTLTHTIHMCSSITISTHTQTNKQTLFLPLSLSLSFSFFLFLLLFSFGSTHFSTSDASAFRASIARVRLAASVGDDSLKIRPLVRSSCCCFSE